MERSRRRLRFGEGPVAITGVEIAAVDTSWRYIASPQTPPGVVYPRAGKWVLECAHDVHEETWRTVKSATRSGSLGFAARTTVTNDSTSRPVTLVYTYDFEDHDDVLRVLGALRALGFAERLAYASGEDTAGRPYAEDATIYVSEPGASSFEDRRSDPMSR